MELEALASAVAKHKKTDAEIDKILKGHKTAPKKTDLLIEIYGDIDRSTLAALYNEQVFSRIKNLHTAGKLPYGPLKGIVKGATNGSPRATKGTKSPFARIAKQLGEDADLLQLLRLVGIGRVQAVIASIREREIAEKQAQLEELQKQIQQLKNGQ